MSAMNKSRDKIIYAAAELMKEKSYRKISVAEICEKAGINRSTFYRNFKDVYDMVEKLPQELLRKLEEFGLDCIGVNSDASQEDMLIPTSLSTKPFLTSQATTTLIRAQ